HVGREVDLVDDEQVRARDARSTLARDLLALGDVDHVDRRVHQLRAERRGQIIAAALDEEQIQSGKALEQAVHGLLERFPGLDLLLIESGGDNLAATFSPELVDATIYVIDVAEGEKIPRKGGPGITRSDLLVINKIDLAPHV